MRLIVARCEVTYTGRLSTQLPESTRLLMIKADGTVMIWSDFGGASVKPLNWMTPPTLVCEEDSSIVVAKKDERLEIRLPKAYSAARHNMGASAALAKDVVERALREKLGAQHRRS